MWFRVLLLVPLVLEMAACSGAAVVESSATAVTVRYGSLDGIDVATQLAQRVCEARQKTARLRNTSNFGLNDRYAHFDCL